MLLSMVLSFVLARKFTGKIYAPLMGILVTLVSLLSMGLLPLSFPLYVSIERCLMFSDCWYYLNFLTFEIARDWRAPFRSGEIDRYYSFFLLVNIIGAIIGYWIAKSKILERLSRQRLSLKQTIKEPVDKIFTVSNAEK